LLGQFDVAVCLETIEHVMDDRKLMRDMAACLKSGGRLLLTTPYYYYRPVTAGDRGPFSKVEDGSHVRRGYTGAMLAELCEDAGLVLERESHCTGLLSQKLVGVQRLLSRLHPLLAWMAVLPFRIFPPLFDRTISRLTGWPYFSICIEAYKPRFRSLGTDRNLLPE
jgi:SAM-dependent methyltransferase